MKHQTYLPKSIPSSKAATQEGKKDTHSLLTRSLVVILVVTFAFALYLTANRLPLKATLNRLVGSSRSYPVVYDAKLAMDKAIVLPNQVANLAPRDLRYDATEAMNSAIVLPGQVAVTASRSLRYDATEVMNSTIVLPGQVAVTVSRGLRYDATGVMLEIITPKEVKVARGPVYDATGVMLKAIVYP
jgi:hypothetical protein